MASIDLSSLGYFAIVLLAVIATSFIFCCAAVINGCFPKPPQNTQGRQPRNPQQAMPRQRPLPRPVPMPRQQILGTVVTYENHQTGETCDDCAKVRAGGSMQCSSQL
ncbi:Uncharacterized protein TCM_041835 [Theobroma cacao]|uniref:Uncharacterized protein n=1 Tax=Theobroma cacao TaxID=3641 RepID=A0A061GX74_THECC|nr:Uncharacterized protein TCM_041835 [Theobroma cacao]